MTTISSSDVQAHADKLFSEGYFCAESVLLALASANGKETKGLSRLVTGFCGGVSRTDGMCGALLGAIAGFGLLYGRDQEDDDKQTVYSLSYHLVTCFKEEFGSTMCSGVLGCDISTQDGAAEFQEKQLEEKRCRKVTAKTAGLAQELIANRQAVKHPLLQAIGDRRNA